MASPFTPATITYTSLGLLAAAGITWFVVRKIRSRKGHGEDPMLTMRRASRRARNAAKGVARSANKAMRRTRTENKATPHTTPARTA